MAPVHSDIAFETSLSGKILLCNHSLNDDWSSFILSNRLMLLVTIWAYTAMQCS